MTAKQIKFCQEYLVDFNATQAAIRSGYSEDTAGSIGHENLKKPEIEGYIAELQKDAANALQITREKVLSAWKSLAYYDARKFYDENGNLLAIQDLDEETAFALAGFEVIEEKGGDGMGNQIILGYTKKIKMSDRTKALEALTKYLGLFEKDNEQSKPLITITGMVIK